MLVDGVWDNSFPICAICAQKTIISPKLWKMTYFFLFLTISRLFQGIFLVNLLNSGILQRFYQFQPGIGCAAHTCWFNYIAYLTWVNQYWFKPNKPKVFQQLLFLLIFAGLVPSIVSSLLLLSYSLHKWCHR